MPIGICTKNFGQRGKGYWIVRRGGQVYSFGDATNFRSYTAPACDPVVAIIARTAGNVFDGYRLVLQSGATVARGSGLDGRNPTGVPRKC